VKAVASDRAAQGAKDVSGIVVGTLDVSWLPVASERDRAGISPGAEVRASVLEVRMRSEPNKPMRVLGCSQHEVAHELNRSRLGGAW
jgi:hypothetical protein